MHSVTCTFEDGKQTRVSYAAVADSEKREVSRDKLWTPGNQPMNLFTDTALSLGDTVIPPGAYAIYMIPNKDKWTMVVSKDVTPGHEYDVKQDLVRSSMQIGHLPLSQPLQISFARMQPKQCGLRIYFGTIGTWTEFNER